MNVHTPVLPTAEEVKANIEKLPAERRKALLFVRNHGDGHAAYAELAASRISTLQAAMGFIAQTYVMLGLAVEGKPPSQAAQEIMRDALALIEAPPKGLDVPAAARQEKPPAPPRRNREEYVPEVAAGLGDLDKEGLQLVALIVAGKTDLAISHEWNIDPGKVSQEKSRVFTALGIGHLEMTDKLWILRKAHKELPPELKQAPAAAAPQVAKPEPEPVVVPAQSAPAVPLDRAAPHRHHNSGRSRQPSVLNTAEVETKAREILDRFERCGEFKQTVARCWGEGMVDTEIAALTKRGTGSVSMAKVDLSKQLGIFDLATGDRVKILHAVCKLYDQPQAAKEHEAPAPAAEVAPPPAPEPVEEEPADAEPDEIASSTPMAEQEVPSAPEALAARGGVVIPLTGEEEHILVLSLPSGMLHDLRAYREQGLTPVAVSIIVSECELFASVPFTK